MPALILRAQTSALLRFSGICRQRTVSTCIHQVVRCASHNVRLSAMTTLRTQKRPIVPPQHLFSLQSRNIFIQTENTPNPDALKFLPNHPILPLNLSSPFLEYLNPRDTLAPPHPSPLAAQLLSVDGVISVFYGADFITITKATDAQWNHIKAEVFSLITEAVSSGAPIVNTVSKSNSDGSPDNASVDSLSYDENDSEAIGMIKELLETRIRPAIQEDGGDIEFRGFVDGMVLLKLRGACRTCESSAVTLRNGIEGMLMHYIEEVKGVTQVLDPEEEVAQREFLKFEEKLKQQKETDTV